MSRSTQWKRVGCLASALALSLTVVGGPTPTASAAVGTPTGLSSGPDGSSTPVLSWTPVRKATGYQVQVDNDASFSSPEFTQTTTNVHATPTKVLRSGTNHWRVRAIKGNDNSDWGDSSFRVSPISVPVPTAPPNGAPLVQPGNPPLLQWNGSPGAESYTVEVDAESDFVGAKVYTTESTSLVVPDPLGEGDWFWRVTAVKEAGLVSVPSGASSFVIIPLDKPRLISPADSVDTKINDVVLDWAPVPGAKSYDVEISDGPTFDPATTTRATGVQGTRFSPETTLNNDQFWWRVRAVDLDGQATTWAQTNFGFNRVFEDQPVAVYPTGSVDAPPSVSNPREYYQWTPVPRASDYELIVASDKFFSNGVQTCRTSSTTYTPRTASDCGFKRSGSTYWAVRPLDKPYDTHGLPGQFASATQGFSWTPPATPPAAFDPNVEVQGMKVSVAGNGVGCASIVCDAVPTTPVLSWTPKPGATSYQVYVGQDHKFTTSVLADKSIPIETTNTMLTLESRATGNSSTNDELAALPDSSAGQAYHWYVRACDENQCGPQPISNPVSLGTKSFRKVSPPVTGLTASDSAGTEITFSWDDYLATNLQTSWLGENGNQSARGYHIQVDDEPSFQAPLLDDQVVDQTTYTAVDRLYPEGTLYWRVQATDTEKQGLTWSAPQVLTKASPTVPLTAPADGSVVPGTTPFRWEPQAFAASYTIEVYRNNDRSFSSVNRLFTATVKNTAYAWKEPIPADAANYVWRVRRTDAEGNPGPWSPASVFTSLGAAPALTSPAAGSWQPPRGSLFTWTDVPGAASYRIAVNGASRVLVTASTQGNAYATSRETPTGSYTWNVTAFDSAGKPLGTSATRSFKVDGTAPTLVKVKGTKLSNKKKAKFVAKFSERVKGVSKKTIKLSKQGSKKKIKLKVKVKGTKVTIKPKARLKKGKTYTLKLNHKRIKDLAGNRLVKPKKLKFTIR